MAVWVNSQPRVNAFGEYYLKKERKKSRVQAYLYITTTTPYYIYDPCMIIYLGWHSQYELLRQTSSTVFVYFWTPPRVPDGTISNWFTSLNLVEVHRRINQGLSLNWNKGVNNSFSVGFSSGGSWVLLFAKIIIGVVCWYNQHSHDVDTMLSKDSRFVLSISQRVLLCNCFHAYTLNETVELNRF